MTMAAEGQVFGHIQGSTRSNSRRRAAEALVEALELHRIQVLNVAGSSEGRAPGMRAYVGATVAFLLERRSS